VSNATCQKRHVENKSKLKCLLLLYVDDGGDARRAPKGVSLAVFTQCLKAFMTKITLNINVVGVLAGAWALQNH
jgi:hypothetical protein